MQRRPEKAADQNQRNAERRQFSNLVGARDRAAEDQDRQLAFVELPHAADEIDAGLMRQPEIEHDEIDLRQIGADSREQFRGALDSDRFVPRIFDGRAKPIAHERGVVGDDDRLRRDRGVRHVRMYRNTP